MLFLFAKPITTQEFLRINTEAEVGRYITEIHPEQAVEILEKQPSSYPIFTLFPKWPSTQGIFDGLNNQKNLGAIKTVGVTPVFVNEKSEMFFLLSDDLGQGDSVSYGGAAKDGKPDYQSQQEEFLEETAGFFDKLNPQLLNIIFNLTYQKVKKIVIDSEQWKKDFIDEDVVKAFFWKHDNGTSTMRKGVMFLPLEILGSNPEENLKKQLGSMTLGDYKERSKFKLIPIMDFYDTITKPLKWPTHLRRVGATGIRDPNVWTAIKFFDPVNYNLIDPTAPKKVSMN